MDKYRAKWLKEDIERKIRTTKSCIADWKEEKRVADENKNRDESRFLFIWISAKESEIKDWEELYNQYFVEDEQEVI